MLTLLPKHTMAMHQRPEFAPVLSICMLCLHPLPHTTGKAVVSKFTCARVCIWAVFVPKTKTQASRARGQRCTFFNVLHGPSQAHRGDCPHVWHIHAQPSMHSLQRAVQAHILLDACVQSMAITFLIATTAYPCDHWYIPMIYWQGIGK